MSEADGKSGDRPFEKKAHRPWKTALLKSTIEESVINPDEETVELDQATPFYADFEFSNLNEKFSQLESIVIKEDLNTSNIELKAVIQQTQQQKSQLEQQINDKSSSPILLGGFFKAGQLTAQADSRTGRKMNLLMTDLKNREQELSSLTRTLEISEAIERAEQAELNKRAEEQRRLAAEQRMRQAIEQAHTAAEQFRLAMDQANQAALAHREEEQLRKLAEDQIKEANLRIASLELDLQDERAVRLNAEEKTLHAASQVTQELSEQLQRLEYIKKTEENRRHEAEQQYDTLHQAFLKMETEHRESFSKTLSFEIKIKELTNQVTDQEQKLAEAAAQRDKLKTIIVAEQDLRKVAEKRAQEATLRSEAAEKARFVEEQQRIITDERARRVVEHANLTVMHLLNAPAGGEFRVEKPKIRVQPAPLPSTAPEPEKDDYSF